MKDIHIDKKVYPNQIDWNSLDLFEKTLACMTLDMINEMSEHGCAEATSALENERGKLELTIKITPYKNENN